MGPPCAIVRSHPNFWNGSDQDTLEADCKSRELARLRLQQHVIRVPSGRRQNLPLWPILAQSSRFYIPHTLNARSASTGLALIRSTAWRVSPVAFEMLEAPAPADSMLLTTSSCFLL